MDFVKVAHGYVKEKKPVTLGKFYEVLHIYWDCFFACPSLKGEETITIFL